MPAHTFQIYPTEHPSAPAISITLPPLKLLPSSLRPDCRAEERIFQWQGVNTPPPSLLPIPILQR